MCLARAANDQVHALPVARALHESPLDCGALTGFEQLNLALADLDIVCGFDSTGVGLVDPLDAAIAVPKPNRHRQGVEESAARMDIARESTVLIEDLHEIALVAYNVPH